MELVQVEILTQTITQQYGTLAQGDILCTSPEFAKHLVEDASAAKYVKAKAASAVSAPPPSAKASEGLNVAQLKEALAAKKIEIPEGVSLKAELAALLDDSQAAE